MADDYGTDGFVEAFTAPPTPHPGSVGIVTSLSPLTVNSTGSDEQVTAMVGYTPALDDAAVLLRMRGMTVAIGTVGKGQAPPPLDPPEQSGSSTFAAQFTYSWRDGSAFEYRSDVRQGALDSSGDWTGAWFYQGAPGGSLAGATVTGCQVLLTRASGGTPGPQAAHVSLSSAGTWPIVGPPTVSGTVTDCVLSPGEQRWFTLPASVGQALVDGSGGLMVAGHSPVVNLAGIDADPESGLLRIDWTG